jgi:hypothetical protein
MPHPGLPAGVLRRCLRFVRRHPASRPCASGASAAAAVAGSTAAPRRARAPARPGAVRVVAVLGAIACVALAGCAAPPKPAAVAAAPAGPPDWDGAYHGTSTRFRAAARDCPHPGVITLYVAQSQFYYRWTRGIEIPATVAPDGTVSGGGPGVGVTGTVRGDRMVGNISDAACGLHFTVVRSF